MADKSGDLEEPDYDKILERQDFFPKIFLMPSQIRLHKDHGLMVVKRNENHPDKFEEEEVLPITVDEKEIRNFDENPTTARHPAGHGLLSLFKRTSKRRIKLAVCICVYSEPKHMLKSTIKGIQQSYRYFLDNAGIMPHEIIMVVIFDGIEKINNSKDQTQNMISYFTEIDIKNGFTHKPYGKSLEEYLKELEERNFNFSVLNEDKLEDMSLFTEDELASLKSKLFENQYNQYIRIKGLLKETENLKKLKDIKIDSLPHDVHKKYQELCLNFCIENNMWYQTQEEIQQYLSSKKNIKIKLIYEALHETQLLCKRYLDSRQDKSILYPVRLEEDDLKNPRIDLNDSNYKAADESKKAYNYMFFCVKHKNEGKLSSHMLFFEGFCKLFDPEYCILTDVGVKPKLDAIYKMWAHMEKNPQCGGVCGYMGLQIQNPMDELGYRDDGYDPQQLNCLTTAMDYFFTVQRAQQFEYHFAHMLDKPFEAAFGYIHVLPGAFSGYRWRALKSVTYKAQEEEREQQGSQSERYTYENSVYSEQEEDQTLMKRYLKTALSEKVNISLEDSNMYLAEDRIMCLGIHALGYTLDYLPDAESVVDPVTSLTRLLGQRRRWINGSWFAFNYVNEHSYESSSWLFYFQMLYYIFVQRVSWIQVTIFYVAMNLTLISSVQAYVVPAISDFFMTNKDYQLYNYKIAVFNIRNVIDSIPDIINFLYIVLIMGNLLYGVLVNNNNDRYKKLYYFTSTILGIYGLIVITLLVVNTVSIILQMIRGQGKQQFIIPLIYLRALIVFVLAGHALPIIWTFSFKKYVEMITSVLSYIYYSPTYVNMLQMFAFSRIDDLSWGTKGLDSDDSSAQRQWERRKYVFVLQYASSNILFSYVLIKLCSFDYPKNVIILSSTCLVAFLLGFRLIFAAIYLIKYYAKRPWKVFSTNYINQNRANGNRILNALNMIELKIKEIEKEKTKKKKQEEYKKLANATSQILSKTLSNFGNKLRSKVAHHMVNNNIIPKKELLDPKKKLKNRRKVNLKKNLNPVEELSNQESEESKTIGKNNTFKKEKEIEKESKEEAYDIVIPQTTKKNDLRARIEAIKEKRSKSSKKISP